MIKLILMTMLFATTSFLGYSLSKIYTNKLNFYIDIVNFTKNLKNEISFLKNDLLSILKKYSYTSNFNQILLEYMDLINTKKYSEITFSEILDKYVSLSQVEKNTIMQMFSELGNLGYYEQIDRLEFYLNYYSDELDKQRDRLTKSASLYKKMGALVGLLVCIVLI